MTDQPKINVFKMSDHKPFEDIIREKCGNEFMFGFVDNVNDTYYIYVSKDLWDRDMAYLVRMLENNLIRRMEDE